MANYSLKAEIRNVVGKGASRRLRRLEAATPAIVYGGDKAPQNITIVHKDLVKQLEDDVFYTSIIDLEIDGVGTEKVVLKALQRHPSKAIVLHADFQRVSADHPITIRVPLRFLNGEACPGVKQGRGTISHAMTELEVKCLPQDLPDYIEVDLINLDIGDILHITDLKLPAGVESVQLAQGAAEHNQPVVSVLAPRGGSAAEEESGEGEA
jgi:large subunit ribosomal protein L25